MKNKKQCTLLTAPSLPLLLCFCISWNFLTTVFLQIEGVSLTPKHRLVDQASVFMSSRDRVVQLYPLTLGIHFSRLLRQAWTTPGLFLFPAITRKVSIKAWQNILFLASSLRQICSEWLLCALHCPLLALPVAQKFWVCWIGVTGSRWLYGYVLLRKFCARKTAVMLASNEYSSSLYDFSAPEQADLYFVSTAKGTAIPDRLWGFQEVKAH